MTSIRLRTFTELIDYVPCWHAMKSYTQTRTPETVDEIWILQHKPVYTLGLAGDPAHIQDLNGIPLVNTDRGGQVTYHGPGQWVFYFLIDLRHYNLNIRTLIDGLEHWLVDSLAACDIQAYGDQSRRGVYINDKKIASIGLKVSRFCCYHGVALNVQDCTEAFDSINTCGHEGLIVTDMKQEGCTNDMTTVADIFADGVLSWLQPDNIERIKSTSIDPHTAA